MRHAIDTRAMWRTDRAHDDDLAVDELDAVVLGEDTRLPHALIPVDRESPRPDLHSHAEDLATSIAGSREACPRAPRHESPKTGRIHRAPGIRRQGTWADCAGPSRWPIGRICSRPW